jgi:hypothetical protein
MDTVRWMGIDGGRNVLGGFGVVGKHADGEELA